MKKNVTSEKPASSRPVPGHIAIVMDGNGRWAAKRGLPRTAGHKAGSETFRRIAQYCRKIGVRYLTVYAFSTENWKRPKEEVAALMSLLLEYLRRELDEKGRLYHAVPLALGLMAALVLL